MQNNKVTNEPIIEDVDTLGQIYVISSENILMHVVRSLSLADDPNFAGKKDGQTLTSRIRALFRSIPQALGLSKDSVEDGKRLSRAPGEGRPRHAGQEFDRRP
jgi:hypothetical protein